MDITTIFCEIDDFCKSFSESGQLRLATDGRANLRKPCLSTSEVMTILVWFHQSGYRTMKKYYQDYVQVNLQKEFPSLPSYNRFVELSEPVLMPLGLYLTTRFGSCTGISFLDSTTIEVCVHQRIAQHKVFKRLRWTRKIFNRMVLRM
jgi:hypothetical protein